MEGGGGAIAPPWLRYCSVQAALVRLFRDKNFVLFHAKRIFSMENRNIENCIVKETKLAFNKTTQEVCQLQIYRAA